MILFRSLLIPIMLLVAQGQPRPAAAAAATLPGTSRANNEGEENNATPLVNLELASTSDGDLFYGQLMIGDEDSGRQPFKLLVSTPSQRSWVASAAGYQGQLEHTYQENKSEQFERTLDTYGGGLATVGMGLYMVPMELGGAALGRQPMGVADNLWHVDQIAQYQVDGLLGLNIDWAWNFTHATNPIRNLYRAGHIEQMVASLYLSADPEADEALGLPGGMLTFGGVNGEYFTGEIDYIPMTADARSTVIGWHINASQPVLDWSRVLASGARGDVPKVWLSFKRFIDDTKPSELHLDSTSPLFVGDTRYLDLYLIGFMGARRFGLSGNYVFEDCRLDNKPDFVFQIGAGHETLELRLEPKDYVVELEHENGRTYCLAGFLAGALNEWTLGTRFLKKHYTVLDFDRELIGFAKPRRF